MFPCDGMCRGAIFIATALFMLAFSHQSKAEGFFIELGLGYETYEERHEVIDRWTDTLVYADGGHQAVRYDDNYMTSSTGERILGSIKLGYDWYVQPNVMMSVVAEHNSNPTDNNDAGSNNISISSRFYFNN